MTVIENWSAYQRELAAKALKAAASPLRKIVERMETAAELKLMAASDARRKAAEKGVKQ